MRNKLLLSAAVAAAMSFGAMADTVKIEKPHKFKDTPPDFEHIVPDHDKAEGKDVPEDNRTNLFGGKYGKIGQQGLIAQDGDHNLATIDQTAANNSLAHIRQDSLDLSSGNTANILQQDHGYAGKFDAEDATNVGIIGQTGKNNLANVWQDAGKNSTVEVHQKGIGNIYNEYNGVNQWGTTDSNATVSQAGINNNADSFQSSTDGSNISILQGFAGQAPIEQNNTAKAYQTGGGDSDIGIEQTGDGHVAVAEQMNAWNSEISIVQSGNDGGVTADIYDDSVVGGNRADARQFDTEHSKTWVDQWGTDNRSVSVQDGADESGILVVQRGFGNRSDVSQSGGDNQHAVVGQLGRANDAFISQSRGSDNDAYVNQIGKGSDASIVQSRDVFADAFISQFGNSNVGIGGAQGGAGNRNVAKITQRRLNPADENNNGRPDTDDDATIQQGARGAAVSGNNANIRQTRDDNIGSEGGLSNGGVYEASVFQFGNNNTADVDQTNGGDAFATIVQETDGNFASIQQVTDISGSEPGVEADIFQSGGDGNSASILQDGIDGAGAYVEQVGSYNLAVVKQIDGGSNDVHVVQEGDWNKAHVTQTAARWSTASVFQNGDYNYGEISQTGTHDDTALIVQGSFDKWGSRETGASNTGGGASANHNYAVIRQ